MIIYEIEGIRIFMDKDSLTISKDSFVIKDWETTIVVLEKIVDAYNFHIRGQTSMHEDNT